MQVGACYLREAWVRKDWKVIRLSLKQLLEFGARMRLRSTMDLTEYLRDKREHAYALALLLLGAAVLVRLALDEIIPHQLPFITFYPAVLVAAYWCGFRPAVVALLLAGVFGALWVPGSDAGMRALSLALFVATAGVPLVLIESLQVALHQLRQHENQVQLINSELKHRIKNLFSITNSICVQTIRSGGAAVDMERSVSGRIMAIAAAQDLLAAASTEGADLNQLVRALVVTLAPDPSRLKVDGPQVRLPADAATPFALILHELGTNAIKYGSWSSDSGYVAVSWTLQNEALLFRWREHDGPAVAPPPREGLGSALIKQGLPTASVTHELMADGLECQITLPHVD